MGEIGQLWVRMTLLGVAAVLAEWALRRANGAVRYALWVTVLGAAVILPLARNAFEEQIWTVGWWRAESSSTDYEPIRETRVDPPLASASNSTQRATIPYAAIVYAAVAVFLLARQYGAARRLKALHRTAQPVEPPEAIQIAVELEYPAAVAFFTASGVRVPFTAGWKTPRIYLPAGWEEWTEAKRRSVLVHEMAHVQRNDWIVSRTAAVLRSIFWAHPLFWWAERRLAALAEEAVDETALALMGDPRAYAGAILDFALARTEQFEPMETTAMARTSKIGSRVERILANRNYNVTRLGRLTAACMAGAALPALYAAALIQPAPQPTPASQAATYLAATPVGPAPVQSPPSSSELAAAEAKVAANHADARARLELIAMCLQSGRRAEAETHAVHLIENSPGAKESVTASLIMIGPDVNSAVVARIETMWIKAAEKYPADVRVLQGAARTLRFRGRYLKAEELLIQASNLEPANENDTLRDRAQLYAAALYASSGGRSGSIRSEPAFAQKARKLLESGTEMPLAGLVGEMMIPPDSIVITNPETEALARASNEKRSQMAETLLRRADELDPGNQRWKASMERLQRVKSGDGVTVVPSPPPPSGVKRITVGGNVQAQMLKSKPEPEYPELARQARVQGTVRFTVVIGRDGTVTNQMLISGHPLLVQAAINALRGYEYRPTTMEGEPVEVATHVDVNFVLGPPDEIR